MGGTGRVLIPRDGNDIVSPSLGTVLEEAPVMLLAPQCLDSGAQNVDGAWP
jgi:hypothetical protein